VEDREPSGRQRLHRRPKGGGGAGASSAAPQRTLAARSRRGRFQQTRYSRTSLHAAAPTEPESVQASVAEQRPNRGESVTMPFGARCWISGLRSGPCSTCDRSAGSDVLD